MGIRMKKKLKKKKKIKKIKKVNTGSFASGKPIRKAGPPRRTGQLRAVKPLREVKPLRAEEKRKEGSLFGRHKSLFLIGITLAVLLMALFGAYAYVIKNYTVTTVYVEGNIHYTNEEVMNMVMEGYYGNNSLLLSLRYKDKSVRGVPFVEKMDVSVLDPHTIKIEVYEKALAGYVEDLERYRYFDKDGIIVESSDKKTTGIPMVTGLTFDHVILYEPLPVENNEIFKEILSITQLVNKYELSIDRIYFGSDSSLTLYFEDVKVALGNSSNLEEKVMELQYMLPDLKGKSGTLRMESYTEETRTTTFEPD